MLPSDLELLAAFPEAPAALHFKTLLTQFKVPGDLRTAFKDQVRALCADEKLERLRGSRYARPVNADAMVGVLTIHARGFGFVNLDAGGDGIYIDARNQGDAMHRDRVRVRVRQQSGGRTEGIIEGVVDRGTHSLVGTYRVTRGGSMVHPQDPRLLDHLPVAPSDLAKDGDRVAVQMVRFPGDPEGPWGKVERVFGLDGEVARETDVIVYDLGLRLTFPPEVEYEVAQASGTITEAEVERRIDLRGMPLVTIDPESARDFDDAIHVSELDEGGWQVTVAIADVAHYVRPGTALDDEAFARGTSIYLPDRVLPMLPERLSNDLCSLRPNEDRLAMVAQFTILPDGELTAGAMCEAVIRSHARFSYDRAARMLGIRSAEDQPQADDDPIFEALRPNLQGLVDAMRARRRWRQRRGYLNLEVGEPRIWFGDDGEVEDVRPGSRHEAHLTVEDAMLAANEVVAGWFVEHRLPALFRVHGQPNEEALARFREQSVNLEAPFKLKGKATPIAFNRYLRANSDHPLSNLLNMLLLRSMAKAVYDESAAPHFGLGTSTYLHFTSPIRRYPDLLVHRLWKRAAQDDAQKDASVLHEAAMHCSRRERVAVEAERTVMDMYKARFLANHVGEEFTGTVIGVMSLGAFIQLDDHAVEGLLPADRLTDDIYRFDKDTGTLRGRKSGREVALGARMRVKIAKVDVAQRKVNLALVRRLGRKRS